MQNFSQIHIEVLFGDKSSKPFSQSKIVFIGSQVPGLHMMIDITVHVRPVRLRR